MKCSRGIRSSLSGHNTLCPILSQPSSSCRHSVPYPRTIHDYTSLKLVRFSCQNNHPIVNRLPHYVQFLCSSDHLSWNSTSSSESPASCSKFIMALGGMEIRSPAIWIRKRFPCSMQLASPSFLVMKATSFFGWCFNMLYDVSPYPKVPFSSFLSIKMDINCCWTSDILVSTVCFRSVFCGVVSHFI